MTNSNKSTVTPLLKKVESTDYGVLDASKNNRAPSLSSEKLFEVKYSECYGNNFDIDTLRGLAIFEILAFESLTEKQLNDIQKKMKDMQNLSFEEIDSKRNDSIIRNKQYTKPEYKLISYHFLKHNKLNVVYEHKDGNEAFTMMIKNNSIEDTIDEYRQKIEKFREKKSFNPKDWTTRLILLKEILKKENLRNA